MSFYPYLPATSLVKNKNLHKGLRPAGWLDRGNPEKSCPVTGKSKFVVRINSVSLLFPSW
ncbi:MAG: hypothetical protein LLG13_16430 [Bacteroidales bacterium]|nr:hypothetical protein [Bacteroidales bacterium]